jgi:hypothetical protein
MSIVWFLRSLSGSPELLSDTEVDPEWEVLSRSAARGVLERCVMDRSQLALLTLTVEGLPGQVSSASVRAWAGDHRGQQFLRDTLVGAIDRDELVVFASAAVVESGPAVVIPVNPAQPAPPLTLPVPLPTLRTFIEIELFDTDGHAAAGERYVITAPDGSQRHGTLDGNGFAREDGLDPGACIVEFPRIDAREWSPAGAPAVLVP